MKLHFHLIAYLFAHQDASLNIEMLLEFKQSLKHSLIDCLLQFEQRDQARGIIKLELTGQLRKIRLHLCFQIS